MEIDVNGRVKDNEYEITNSFN